MKKQCSRCREVKKLNEFGKDKGTHSPTGLNYWCKLCVNERSRESRQNDPEKGREKQKIWRNKNKKYIKQYKQEYNAKLEVKERRNKLQRKRRKKDMRFRISGSMSACIRSRLKKRLSSKNNKSTFDFLPYTLEELMQHLESKFETWMNWNSYGFGEGKWVIDHIKPDSSFNYKSTDDKEFQECWALSNLQPMEWLDNIKKSNKY